MWLAGSDGFRRPESGGAVILIKMEFTNGTNLGHYEFRYRLGKGRMGEVY